MRTTTKSTIPWQKNFFGSCMRNTVATVFAGFENFIHNCFDLFHWVYWYTHTRLLCTPYCLFVRTVVQSGWQFLRVNMHACSPWLLFHITDVFTDIQEYLSVSPDLPNPSEMFWFEWKNRFRSISHQRCSRKHLHATQNWITFIFWVVSIKKRMFFTVANICNKLRFLLTHYL